MKLMETKEKMVFAFFSFDHMLHYDKQVDKAAHYVVFSCLFLVSTLVSAIRKNKINENYGGHVDLSLVYQLNIFIVKNAYFKRCSTNINVIYSIGGSSS